MKKRAAWFIAIGILCLVLLAVCVSDISRSFVVRVDNNSWSADEPTPVSAPVTYTDKNGITRSIADDPPAGEWDGPSDDVWGVTPDGDREHPLPKGVTAEDAAGLNLEHVPEPNSKSPWNNGSVVGIDAGWNIEPGPGPDTNPSYRNG